MGDDEGGVRGKLRGVRGAVGGKEGGQLGGPARWSVPEGELAELRKQAGSPGLCKRGRKSRENEMKFLLGTMKMFYNRFLGITATLQTKLKTIKMYTFHW